MARRPSAIRKVRIAQLKAFVDQKCPTKSTLRELILGEPDEIDAVEFLTKVEDWLRILRIESRKKLEGP